MLAATFRTDGIEKWCILVYTNALAILSVAFLCSCSKDLRGVIARYL
jgi:hypothetical protein